MKLATLNDGSLDGCLVVVSRDLSRAVSASAIVPSMQAAMEQWSEISPELENLYLKLNSADVPGSFVLDTACLAAPLPRAGQWLDGSCFLSHGQLMQKAFNLDPIEGIESIPLMYQGASDDFVGPCVDVPLISEEHGIDFEGEFAVMVGAVPMGCPAHRAGEYIRLILQLNDFSLRTLGPREMKTGFGFVRAKAATSFAPVAVTPDELGEAWKDHRVHLALSVEWNGEWFGNPHGGAMHFGFHELIAHAAFSRRLSAGTVIGSGTVSNEDRSVGSACIAERRAIETIATGAPKTRFMRFGDKVRMEARISQDEVLFGAIDQRVVQGGWPCE